MTERAEDTAVIPGRYALSVGNPKTTLPAGWSWVLLTEVACLESGHTPSRKIADYWGGEIPWVGIRDAREHHGGLLYETLQRITQEGVDNSSARLLPVGTVCLSRTASVGYVVVLGVPMATSQDFLNWTCTSALDPHFLKYVLMGEGSEGLAKFGRGSVHTTIYFPTATALHIALPPMETQRQIVRALDEALRRVTHVRASLDAVDSSAELVERMTLSAALRGEFTGDRLGSPTSDRASSTDRGEVGERRRRPSTEAMGHRFPASWAWSHLGKLADVQGGLAKNRREESRSGARHVPYLRVANVQRGRLDLSEVRTVPASEEDVQKLKLHEGDILLNEGGDRDQLGRGWTWDDQLPECIHQNHVFRARISNRTEFHPTFVAYWANSEFATEYFFRVASQSVNLASISTRNLSLLQVPKPPLSEQQGIVAAMDDMSGRLRDTRSAIERGRNAVDQVEAALMRLALQGRLRPPTADGSDIGSVLAQARIELNLWRDAKRAHKDTIKKLGGSVKATQYPDQTLSSLVRERGPQTPAALWAASRLSIDEFYRRLRAEVRESRLCEVRRDRDGAELIMLEAR